jgi:hypothetical protein
VVDGDGIETGNIASVYAADGSHLGDLAYRPHEIGNHGFSKEGLFLC